MGAARKKPGHRRPTAVGGNSCAPGSTPGAVGAARCWGDTLHQQPETRRRRHRRRRRRRGAAAIASAAARPAPAPRRRSPTPPPLPPLQSFCEKAAGSASPLPKDDGGSANDGSADRAGGEAWVCSPGSCAPGSAPGGVGVAGCTPPCVYGSDAAASTGVLPRPEIPSIALSEVERESSSLCSLVVRASPPQPSSVWEASCAASDATRRGVSASPPPPSETAAAHASGPSSEAGATSSPALGAASPKAACAVNGEGASVGAGVGTAAGAAARPFRRDRAAARAGRPDPLATALSALEAGGDLARGVALAGTASPPMPGCAAASAAAPDAVDRRVDRGEPEYRPTGTGGRVRRFVHERWGGRPSAAAASPCPGRREPAPSGWRDRSARIWRAGEGAGQKPAPGQSPGRRGHRLACAVACPW